MSDFWKAWIGELVDGQFPLRQYLGHTEHSAVFLTECSEPETRRAVIKFVAAEGAFAERQLSLWSHIAQLHHPNLLPVLHAGRCRMTDMDLLYVVMEYADEDLAQVLSQRSLTVEETRDMLNPLMDALIYLHDKGLVHGHLKPSNILAQGDQLKISSDTILIAGEPQEMHRDADLYDAPEVGRSAAPAGAIRDSWSLGMTLVQALTQQTPALPYDHSKEPTIPEDIPQPFQEIAAHLLCRDPERRWSCLDVAERLSPSAVATSSGASTRVRAKTAAASASVIVADIASAPASGSSAIGPTVATPSKPQVSALSVPLSSEPAVPLTKLTTPSGMGPRPERSKKQQHELTNVRNSDVVLPSYVIPVLLGLVVIVIAVAALPKLFRHRSDLPASVVSSSDSGQSAANDSKVVAPPPVGKAAQTADSEHSAQPTNPSLDNEKQRAANTDASPHSGESPADSAGSGSAARRETKTADVDAQSQKTSSGTRSRGEVLNEVLPEASGKALATIHGTVRVSVRAHVDAAGRVTNAQLDSTGPSRYFADRALQAARQWVFSTPELDDRSAPSEWLIRFEFSSSGAKAFPTQVSP